jgi:periplasmic protein CpxP/Spy
VTGPTSGSSAVVLPNVVPLAQSGARQGHRGSRLEWLSTQLNRTEDQKARPEPILQDQAKQTRATQEDTSLTQDQKRDKMKQVRKTTDSQINDILTPDQQKKFAELKEQQKENRQGTRANPSEQPKQP